MPPFPTGNVRWARWDERVATVTDDEGVVEWWVVLVLPTTHDERVHFIERGTAEVYARFLVEEDAPIVVLERWRATGRVSVELIEAPPDG